MMSDAPIGNVNLNWEYGGILGETKRASVENMETAPEQRHNSDDVSATSVLSVSKNSGLAYDSGNYTISSNNSEISCPFELDLNNHCQHIHILLKERDQALFTAMQDVRKLRSELERLNKSEEWYKKELRAQKNTRLQALERLYSQERKYMQENQRLQRECVRLYEKCGDLEKQMQAKRDKAMQKLVEDEQLTNVYDETDEVLNKFELEQQRALVNDQEKLISVLRKQKHVLLEDLSRLNAEKDAKVLELQETLAGVEVENTHMTAQCKRLIKERQMLEDTLKTKDQALNAEIAERLKMTTLIEQLKEQSKSQQELLAHKEHEIQVMQQNFNDNMQNEWNMDEVHRLSMSYHDDINAKTAEISSLKKSLYALQLELNTLTDLQTQHEAQTRQIDQLNFSLETQNCELKNLKQTDEEKAQQITELQQNLVKIRTQHDITLEQMCTEQSNLKSIKRELIALHEQYASMCALCEKTRFQLEILEIENGKLRFQSNGDKREIDALREKLKGYLKHTSDLGKRINELEAKLQSATERNTQLQAKLGQYEKGTGTGAEQEHFSNENKQIIQENRALKERLDEHNNSFEDCRVDQKDTGSVNENEGDDSGFLEATNVGLSECEDRRKSPDLQHTSDADCATITAVNGTLLEQLNHQSEILKERQILIAALEELICNGASTIDNDSSITSRVEANQPVGGLTAQQQQLMAYLNSQSLLIEEKRKLLEAFETLFNEKPGPHENSHDFQSLSNIRKIIDENKKLKNTVNTKEADVLMSITNIKDNIEKATAFGKEVEYLRKKLQENDERYLKDRGEQERLHGVQMQSCEASMQHLQTENERLMNEMQSLLEAKFQIENALEQQTQLIDELKSKLSALEINEDTCEANNTPELPPGEREELLRLRAKVEELEKRLAAALKHDEARRNERVRLLQQLIEQQNGKVKQLTESQADWEELLTALQVAQKLEESARAELQLKHTELEELNALFAEQNEELRQLQAIALLAKSKEEEPHENAQTNCEMLQAKLSAQLAASAAQQRQIEELQGKNARLERQLNEDYAEEMARNQRQLRALQTKMDKLKTERNEYAERLAAMETELQQLRKSKRDGLVLPPEFVVLSKKTLQACDETATSNDANVNTSGSESDSNERMRILTKVLEAEYRRKMKRYDLHIHTLLGNIRKLKKTLRATEQRAAHLTHEQCKTMEELHELRLTGRQLEEMRLKCEHNQNTIKALEQALEMERKKFEASDLGKAAHITRDSAAVAQSSVEPAHEVANLIDDYKKLIQQSALATRRPKTSSILELIQRSNQCVPNLHKLDASVDGLRKDLAHFLSAHTRNMRAVASAQKLDGPSLLDELRAATETY
ncbi:PREDICTED: putative leucine-rich repeat-containing protein DDB_G0290503 isoform X1 [Bactrocera latifrons]|uniref:putative leucine-rich repeat-containing protein DDB_G0290503 isoform X1 n=1 Tax=Bactrocera latifrons TaxID=174628 RepID=UPI0008DC90DB|nr:PREDICTED: putative leucine-rich repeat-containing protein DDB_G0290503 isoform X1 [Bactrocera latifrons]XP_018785435.1 PREDICTED: putative leucine-rich repeat-containing protein DDB_G0290503 isoform X1 [Bactrocera latifrons]